VNDARGTYARVTDGPEGRPRARRSRILVVRLLGAALGCIAAGANAQLMSVHVTGAVEEARAFNVYYRNAEGTLPDWFITGKLVVVYRVTVPSGTVTVDATLLANTPPRLANGTLQFINIKRVDRGATFDEAQGPPAEALTVSHSFAIDATDVGRQTFIVSAGPFPGRCGTSEACATVELFVVVITQSVPRLALLGGPSFPLVIGPPAPTFLQMSLFGPSPFTEVSGVAIDGVSLTRVPSSVVPLNQSPGAGNWDRIPQDPLHPDAASYPGSSPTKMEDFLGCFSGGCASPGLRVGMPATLGPGPHSISVTGAAYQATSYSFFSDPVPVEPTGSANLYAEGDFIVIDPQLQVSPPQAEPGATITVSGTGFAPNNDIPVRLEVICCGGLVSLGTAHVGSTGAFSQPFVLPAANVAPLFITVWPSTAPPGTPTPGLIFADVGDAAFVTQYGSRGGPKSAPIAFLKPGAAPTTTTLPPQACGNDAACDDGDPCTQDTCPAGVCVHTPLTGAAGIACSLPPTGVRPSVCTSQTIPRKTEKQYGKANTFLGRAVNKVGNAARRLIKKADKALKRAGRAVEVANLNDDLSDECAQGITELIDGVRARIKLALE
jgi:hypothetical protein